MKAKYEMLFTGAGGQGVILCSIILAEAAFLTGKNVAQSQSYGPEARGGLCRAELVIDEAKIVYPKVTHADFLLALTQASLDKADCGSDHELLIAKFRLKLKKVGKTTRPFRYDLNQIPYDYTVEVRNRFKGLDLIDLIKSMMNYRRRFVTLYRRQGSRPSPWKRNAEKQNGCLGRHYK